MNATTRVYERRLLEIKRTPLLLCDVARKNVSIEEIQVRVKAVRPLRKGTVGSRPPTHWGINE